MPEIRVEGNLKTAIQRYYSTKLYSDVILSVGGEKYAVHRIILAAQSPFFEGLFSTNFIEGKQKDIELNELKTKPWEALLKYMYEGKLEIGDGDIYDVIDLLELAHFLRMEREFDAIAVYIKKLELNTHNIIPLINIVDLFEMKDYKAVLLNKMENMAKTILKIDTFETVNKHFLEEFLERADLNVEEIDLFLAVDKWIKANKYPHPKDLLYKIELANIMNCDLLRIVLPTGYFSNDEIFSVIARKEEGLRKVSRAQRKGRLITKGRFLASKKSAVNGENILADSLNSLDLKNGNPVLKSIFGSLVFELRESARINEIELVMPYEQEPVNLLIETSTDNFNYKVIQENLKCDRRVRIYFPPETVNYVRVRIHTTDVKFPCQDFMLSKLNIFRAV